MKFNFLHYLILFLFITSLAVVSCKTGEDGATGSDGSSYIQLSWTDSEDTKAIIFVGTESTTDIAFPVKKGIQKLFVASDDEGIQTSFWVNIYYDTSGRNAAKTAYAATPGTRFVYGTTDSTADMTSDASWDADSRIYDFDYEYFTVADNNVGKDGEEGTESIPDGINGDNGIDGLDRYNILNPYTLTTSVTEE